MSVNHHGSCARLGNHKRGSIKASHAMADVQLSGNELVFMVAAPIELSPRATLIEDFNKLIAMPFKQRDRRLSLW